MDSAPGDDGARCALSPCDRRGASGKLLISTHQYYFRPLSSVARTGEKTGEAGPHGSTGARGLRAMGVHPAGAEDGAADGRCGLERNGCAEILEFPGIGWSVPRTPGRPPVAGRP